MKLNQIVSEDLGSNFSSTASGRETLIPPKVDAMIQLLVYLLEIAL